MTQQEKLEMLEKNTKHLGLSEREQHYLKHSVECEDVEGLFVLLAILERVELYGYNKAAGMAQEAVAGLDDIFNKVMSLCE